MMQPYKEEWNKKGVLASPKIVLQFVSRTRLTSPSTSACRVHTFYASKRQTSKDCYRLIRSFRKYEMLTPNIRHVVAIGDIPAIILVGFVTRKKYGGRACHTRMPMLMYMLCTTPIVRRPQEKAYHDTRPRIFPGPGGIQTVMENMLRDSEKRIDSAAKPGSGRPAAVGGPPLPSSSPSDNTQKHKAVHRELKVRPDMVQKQAMVLPSDQESCSHLHAALERTMHAELFTRPLAATTDRGIS